LVEVYCTPFYDNFLEEPFKRFFVEEASHRGGELYIISPWITKISFERRLVYHPYLDAGDSVEALAQLAKLGKRIYVVTRYHDDVLKPYKLYFWYQLYRAYMKETTPELIELYNEMVEEVKQTLHRIEILEELSRINGVSLKFNSKVHSKIYVGEKYAIIGSANFTAPAWKNLNDECILLISREEEVYSPIKKYAEEYFHKAMCENAYLKALLQKLYNSKLNFLGLNFDSLEAIKSFLRSII